MKKILILIIGLMLITTFVNAESVYTETESYQVEVLEDGQIQVRKATRVFKDGEEIAKYYHRHVLEPGSNLTQEVKKVRDISNAAWTEEVITKYEIEKEKRKKKLP